MDRFPAFHGTFVVRAWTSKQRSQASNSIEAYQVVHDGDRGTVEHAQRGTGGVWSPGIVLNDLVDPGGIGCLRPQLADPCSDDGDHGTVEPAHDAMNGLVAPV